MESKFLIEYNEFIKGPINVFMSFGFIPYKDSVKLSKVQAWLLNILWRFSIVNLIVTILLEFINFISITTTEFDIVYATTIIVYMGMSVMAVGKLFAIWNNRTRVKTIVETLEDMFPKVLEDQIDMNVNRYRRDLMTTVKPLFILFVIAVWFFNLGPIGQSLFEHYVLGQEFVYLLPYSLWYPFKVKSVVPYMLLAVTHWSAGYVTVAAILACDWLLCSIVAQLCMHFDTITRKLRQLNPIGVSGDHEPLQQLVKYHIIALKLSDDINDIFNFSILYNFLSGSLMLCAGAFQIVSGVDVVALTKFLMFLVVEQFQVLLICYFGHRLMDASDNVRFGAYEQNWVYADVPYKRSILMIILRSNKPCVLNAVSFAIVSLESFNKVLSLAYKFFAVLRTVY